MQLKCLAVGFFLVAVYSYAHAETGIVLESDELVVVRTETTETCMMPGFGYSDFSLEDETASLTIEGLGLPAGSKVFRTGGIRKISWEPSGDNTQVEIKFESEPISSLVNAVAGSELRPQTPQITIGFGYSENICQTKHQSIIGRRNTRSNSVNSEDYGNYELPKLPQMKYSDALVTLQVRNTDFREVLWLLSEIGGVSIMLDPYWDDEPTGSRRPPAGGGGGSGSGGGSGGAGFRGGGDFFPTPPREGTGNLTLNFFEVPFDTALELVVMSAGLVKVDIWPGDM